MKKKSEAEICRLQVHVFNILSVKIFWCGGMGFVLLCLTVLFGWTEIWLDWLKDEIRLTEDESDREKVYELFERAVKDYLCKSGSIVFIFFGSLKRVKICIAF